MNRRGKGNGKGGVIFLILIIVGLLIWGYIGGKNTSDLTTCNIHFSIFCWKWSTNVTNASSNAIGQAKGTVGNLFNGS
jgi:hypothetical protein